MSKLDKVITEISREYNPEALADRLLRLELTPEKGYRENNTDMKRLEEANRFVNDKDFCRLACATVISEESTIILPPGRYDHCSRAKCWARQGKGPNAVWGDKVKNGYEVGPGKWTVGSSDGFKRSEQKNWEVHVIKVGSDTWLAATEE